MILSIHEIIGPFHPVLVHLPIGILLFALVLQWLGTKERYTVIQPAIQIAYLLGCISAIAACITGLSLGSAGEYDEETLDLHQWMGLSVAVISAIGYVLSRMQMTNPVKSATAVVILVMVTITGHLGGTLTHGEGYLTKSFNTKDSVLVPVKKIIPDIQQAQVYPDIVQPLLQEKCYGCHSSTKQKGGLRLDGKDWILKGGKDGLVLANGTTGESELYKRILLDPLEEHHMPPKGKPQLNEKQIAILHWWIVNGNTFDKRVNELEQPGKIKTFLLSFQSKPGDAEKRKDNFIPEKEVEKAPEASIIALQKRSVSIIPVASNSNYLMANFVSVPYADDKAFAMLAPLQKQLIWLKLGSVKFSKNSLETIAGCTAIRRLSLEHSNLSDSTIGYLKTLEQLRYLNLVGTKITAQGLLQLKDLKLLEHIYLGQTMISKSDWPKLIASFPKVTLDSGGYRVQALVTDTMLMKVDAVKK